MNVMDLTRFDLNLLVLFEALHDERSVSGAARRLNLGQPAASAALARLRKLTGDELFIRSGGEMCPTPWADDFIPIVRDVLSQLRSALYQADVFDPKTTTTVFTVAHSDYTALVTLPKFLARFRKEAPHATLRIVGYDKGDIGPMIDKSEADVILGVFQGPPPNSVVTHLYDETFVGLAARDHPAFRRSNKIGVEDFARLPHAIVSLRRDLTGYVDLQLQAKGLKRKVCVVAPYMFALGAAIAGTDLVATLPKRAAEALSQQGLRTFALPFPTEPWSVTMLWNSSSRSDPARLWLRQLIIECVGAQQVGKAVVKKIVRDT